MGGQRYDKRNYERSKYPDLWGIDVYKRQVTTYRVDGKYEDHRRPNEVHFTKSLREDLLRRDFTINAMAYNDSEGIIDMYDGMTDLKNQTIRCVGEAKKRRCV